jgi:hypothetical protein
VTSSPSFNTTRLEQLNVTVGAPECNLKSFIYLFIYYYTHQYICILGRSGQVRLGLLGWSGQPAWTACYQTCLTCNKKLNFSITTATS